MNQHCRHLPESRSGTEKLLNEYITYLMEHSDWAHPAWNLELMRSRESNKWNYIDGCMINGILQLYEITGDSRYLDFADRFVSGFVGEDGSVRTYDRTEYSLDNINPAMNLFRLYDCTGRPYYRKATEEFRRQLYEMPRTGAGNFWHKKIYPDQVWLDGIYMALPFYLEYARRNQEEAAIADCFRQLENVEQCMRDPLTGLYYHGYDESRRMYWADPVTGCSPNFWLRAIGWFILGLTDILDILRSMDRPQQSARLGNMLQMLASALLPWQDETGLYYQLPALPAFPGNYLETSGTALIAAAMLKAVRLGFLPETFAESAEKAFYGICDHRLTRNADGTPCLSGICLVGGLGGRAKRDGSAAYYLGEPVVKNDAKGVGPFLLAYTEMRRI